MIDLVDILRQQIQDRAYTEMLPRLEDNQFIIPETIHIAEERSDWMTFDHQGRRCGGQPRR